MTMEQIRNSQSEEWDPDNEGYFAVTHGNHPLNSDLYDSVMSTLSSSVTYS